MSYACDAIIYVTRKNLVDTERLCAMFLQYAKMGGWYWREQFLSASMQTQHAPSGGELCLYPKHQTTSRAISVSEHIKQTWGNNVRIQANTSNRRGVMSVYK